MQDIPAVKPAIVFIIRLPCTQSTRKPVIQGLDKFAVNIFWVKEFGICIKYRMVAFTFL
ncbi:hypothetical protein D3C85_1529570 [compost metagenome]